MEIGFLQLLAAAFFAVLLLKPDELSAIAKKMGRWMGEVKRLGEEFTHELGREADMLDVQDELKNLNHEIDDELKSGNNPFMARKSAAPLKAGKKPVTTRERKPAESVLVEEAVTTPANAVESANGKDADDGAPDKIGIVSQDNSSSNDTVSAQKDIAASS